MTGITTHVLDTSTGKPAAGLAVALVRGSEQLASGRTDDDGRWVAADDVVEPGAYALLFATAAHFHGKSFHPHVRVDFTVTDSREHHHVPLLLSPFGYTTYRGS